MEFLRLGPAGAEVPAVRASDGVVYDLRPVTADIDGSRRPVRLGAHPAGEHED